ncbi:MAG: hypothetical protein V1891_00055 [bacterium]
MNLIKQDIIFASGYQVIVEGLSDFQKVEHARLFVINGNKVVQAFLVSGEVVFFCHKSGDNGDSVFVLTHCISSSFITKRLSLSIYSCDK